MGDVAIKPVGLNDSHGVLRKPLHLVHLKLENRAPYFLCLDTPTVQFDGFITCRGAYISNDNEEKIVENLQKIFEQLTGADRSSILEVFFPTTQVVSVRNLAFKTK